MSSQRSNQTQAVDSRTLRKVVTAGAIGNFTEWYDFAVYGFLATILATNFFPSEDPTASLLATFAVFGVAFVLRPIGGIVMGVIGDRIGRRTTLAFVLLLMAAATTAIGLLPTYGQIGILAPALLVIARCAQGFSAGGEYAGASALVVEYAPPTRRAFLSSFLSVSTYSAFAVAAALVLLLTSSLSDEAMATWGWRIPFLLGAPLGLVGLFIRLRIQDTPAFRAAEETESVTTEPLAQTLRTNYKLILVLSGFIMSNALGFYTFTSYVPTYLQEVVNLESSTALLFNVSALLFTALILPVFGLLSDRIGRKPVMVGSCLWLVVMIIPIFLLAGQTNLVFVIVGQLLFAVGMAASNAVTAVTMTEMFSTQIRYTSSSISYNLAYLVFGGTAPFIATYLIATTENPISPAFYLALVALIAIFAALRLPETYKRSMVENVSGE